MTAVASSESTPRVCISVVNWNTAHYSLRCLQSLSALDDPDCRIVLVDNGSTDDSVAQIKARFPQIEVLQSSTNLGFAAAHALTWQWAKTKGFGALWLVNSDCEVEPAALRKLVDAWRSLGDALYGGVPLAPTADGGLIINFPTRFLQYGQGGSGVFRKAPLRYDSAWFDRKAFVVEALPGACLLVPLAIVESHGWLDDSWFLYCEELDYCQRLGRRGVRSYLVPQARVTHRGGGSHEDRPHVGDCIAYYQTRNEIRLARKYSGRMAMLLIIMKKIFRSGYLLLRRPARGLRMLWAVVDALRGKTGKTLAPEVALQEDRAAADNVSRQS